MVEKLVLAIPPYIIAELSANHNQKIENALQIVEEAKRAGADAVKIQTYRPDTITLDCDTKDFQIQGGLWDGRTLFELYQEAHMPWDWHETLFKHAADIGITIFSSPFDFSAIDLLEKLNAPAYKIASFEAVDLPLIRYAASTGKPLIISTGMADAEEIREAMDAASEAGCKELALLHCVSGYPAPAMDYNLNTIPDMSRQYNVCIGLSDHTLDNATALASIALERMYYREALTLDRNSGGPDDSFSLEPAGFTALCDGARTAWEALGKVNYKRKSSEQGNVQFRRSLYFIKNMKAGDIITTECIRSVRPGYGIAPKYFDDLIGRRALVDIGKFSAVKWDLID